MSKAPPTLPPTKPLPPPSGTPSDPAPVPTQSGIGITVILSVVLSYALLGMYAVYGLLVSGQLVVRPEIVLVLATLSPMLQGLLIYLVHGLRTGDWTPPAVGGLFRRTYTVICRTPNEGMLAIRNIVLDDDGGGD